MCSWGREGEPSDSKREGEIRARGYRGCARRQLAASHGPAGVGLSGTCAQHCRPMPAYIGRATSPEDGGAERGGTQSHAGCRAGPRFYCQNEAGASRWAISPVRRRGSPGSERSLHRTPTERPTPLLQCVPAEGTCPPDRKTLAPHGERSPPRSGESQGLRRAGA